MTIFNDKHYINLVLNGAINEYEVLVNQYKNFVYSLAFKMVKNSEDAEEVAQDSFLKAYKSLKSFNEDSKFSTWLYKITYNICLDYLRKNKIILADIYANDVVKNLDSDDITAIKLIEKKELKSAVQNCLNQLPNADAFLLSLYYYEDLSIKEIALIMNLNSNHIKIKLHRSRKKMALILKSTLEPEILETYEK